MALTEKFQQSLTVKEIVYDVNGINGAKHRKIGDNDTKRQKKYRIFFSKTANVLIINGFAVC